jgi:uncharacterized protein
VEPPFALASQGGAAARLEAVLHSAPHVMDTLRAAREVDAPDWLLCAGAIRDSVWDAAHERAPGPMPRDIDVAFFDAANTTPQRDLAVEQALVAEAPSLPWQAKNQAAVHQWYPAKFGVEVPPFHSCAEGIATFPETATCVGVRLLDNDDLLVVAAHGLDDLFDCICRHNPTRVSPDFYERRIEEKGWHRRWPKMHYVPPIGR